MDVPEMLRLDKIIVMTKRMSGKTRIRIGRLASKFRILPALSSVVTAMQLRCLSSGGLFTADPNGKNHEWPGDKFDSLQFQSRSLIKISYLISKGVVRH